MSHHNRLRNKIVDEAALFEFLDDCRSSHRKIVFTNGCFDILHPGHVDYLAQARDQGDVLVLGLNTDASVRSLEKAPGRPVNPQDTRALVLAGLESVDRIVLFDDPTPAGLISRVKPDVLVKGNDYTVEQVAGHEIVQSYGGKVVLIPLLQGFSTTALIRKITG